MYVMELVQATQADACFKWEWQWMLYLLSVLCFVVASLVGLKLWIMHRGAPLGLPMQQAVRSNGWYDV